MFWSCFCKSDTGPLVPIAGTMNSEKYQEVIGQHSLPQMQQWFSGARLRGCHFQQDNASCQKSANTLLYLQQQRIRVLEWPPYSPDVAPIENLWAIIKQHLNQSGSNSRDDLIQKVTAIWNNHDFIAPQIDKLVESMPRRIQ